MRVRIVAGLAVVFTLGACASQGKSPAGGNDDAGIGGDAGATAWMPALGAHWSPAGDAVSFRVASTRATRVELWLYDQATNAAALLTVPLVAETNASVWSTQVAQTALAAAGFTASSTIYYGYRVWGPNWPYDATWTPGSTAGWITDVDTAGNRMNPNKLVFDPYARELSHDPLTPMQQDGSPYAVGSHRAADSAAIASKGIVLPATTDTVVPAARPTRALRDDIIYEVNVRGFTEADTAAGACAGTFAGAATRADYLASLGVTAIELLPIAETQNDQNDITPTTDAGDNYWGYSTLAYFAPDRRYACDRTPGGPTRELAAMVGAFHARGIKVLLDVVYNHTAEGGGSSLYSMRGLDNAGYYQLDVAGTGFTNSNGVGADVAGDKPLAANLVLDSLHYWVDRLGIDGFRFDEAPVLGNTCGPGCFTFDAAGLPARIAAELGRTANAGSGADLIAEPWGVADGSYQVGNFPAGWSEWNDHFRDTVRQDQNQAGTVAITGGQLATRITGSPDLFEHGGQLPSASVNYLVSHDGFSLADLYACDASNNTQAWPYGPSDGGTTNNESWDHGGDATAQRQAIRTGLAMMALSQGVPMITGGDELQHTQRCNNNPYNLDSTSTWLDWTQATSNAGMVAFTSQLFAFRAAHPALRVASWIGDSLAFHDATGALASSTYQNDATQPIVAWSLDGTALGDPSAAIYVVYNRGTSSVTVTLPSPPGALAWLRTADTSSGLEASGNIAAPGSEYRMHQLTYGLASRSLAIFIAAP